LAQFHELQAFAQFGAADLDKATRGQLERGRRITEVLKQVQHSPLSLGKEAVILYAVTNGYLDDIPVAGCVAWEVEFFRFADTSHPELEKRINDEKEINPETEQALKSAILQFKAGGSHQG
jgi:F-type H+-transporting ATPase subunit alpha